MFNRDKTPSRKIKILCILTSAIFTLESLVLAVPDANLALETLRVMPVTKVEIPYELGIQEAVRPAPSASSSIIHIQDPHGSFNAQIKIESLIRYLSTEHGFDHVLVEGSHMPLSASHFDFFEDSRLNAELARRLMRRGSFTAAEWFLMNGVPGKSGVRVQGIENAGLYRKSARLFRRIVRFQQSEPCRDFELQTGAKLDLLVSRAFSGDAHDFIREWLASRRHTGDTFRFIGILAKHYRDSLGFDLSDPAGQDEYPMIIRVLKLKQLEKDLDWKQIKKENGRIADLLRGKVPDDLLNWFQDPSQKMPGGSGQRFLLENLIDAARKNGEDLRLYPAFAKFAAYSVLQSEIESRRLFEEIERAGDRVLAKLAAGDEPRKIIRLLKDFELLRHALRLELIRKDYEELSERFDELESGSFASRMNEMGPRDKPVRFGAGFSKNLKNILRFYELTDVRDKVFVESASRILEASRSKKAIIITGGFHSKGLEEGFSENGIGYMRVSPRVTEADNGRELYLRAMLGERAEVSQSETGSGEDASLILAPHLIPQEAQRELLTEKPLAARNRFLAEDAAVIAIRTGQWEKVQTRRPDFAPYWAQAASLGDESSGEIQPPQPETAAPAVPQTAPAGWSRTDRILGISAVVVFTAIAAAGLLGIVSNASFALVASGINTMILAVLIRRWIGETKFDWKAAGRDIAKGTAVIAVAGLVIAVPLALNPQMASALWSTYLDLLKNHYPFLMSSLTIFISAVVGDLMAQAIEKWRGAGKVTIGQRLKRMFFDTPLPLVLLDGILLPFFFRLQDIWQAGWMSWGIGETGAIFMKQFAYAVLFVPIHDLVFLGLLIAFSKTRFRDMLRRKGIENLQESRGIVNKIFAGTYVKDLLFWQLVIHPFHLFLLPHLLKDSPDALARINDIRILWIAVGAAIWAMIISIIAHVEKPSESPKTESAPPSSGASLGQEDANAATFELHRIRFREPRELTEAEWRAALESLSTRQLMLIATDLEALLRTPLILGKDGLRKTADQLRTHIISRLRAGNATGKSLGLIEKNVPGERPAEMVYDEEIWEMLPADVRQKIERVIVDYRNHWYEDDIEGEVGFSAEKRSVKIAWKGTIGGEEIDGIEVSGVLFTRENYGQDHRGLSWGSSGLATSDLSEDAIRELAVDVAVSPDGRPKLTPAEFAQIGGHGFATARKKFENARTALPEKGLRGPIAVGYGKYTGLSKNGKPLGVFISASRKGLKRFKETLRLSRDNYELLMDQQRRRVVRLAETALPPALLAGIRLAGLALRIQVPPEELARHAGGYIAFDLIAQVYGQILREAIDRGFYPHSPHFGNFAKELDATPPIWFDLGGWQNREELTPEQAFGYAYMTLTYALVVIKRDLVNPHPYLYEKGLINPYRAFLRAFFHDRLGDPNFRLEDFYLDAQGRISLERAAYDVEYRDNPLSLPPLIERLDQPFVRVLRTVLGMPVTSTESVPSSGGASPSAGTGGAAAPSAAAAGDESKVRSVVEKWVDGPEVVKPSRFKKGEAVRQIVKALAPVAGALQVSQVNAAFQGARLNFKERGKGRDIAHELNQVLGRTSAEGKSLGQEAGTLEFNDVTAHVSDLFGGASKDAIVKIQFRGPQPNLENLRQALRENPGVFGLSAAGLARLDEILSMYESGRGDQAVHEINRETGGRINRQEFLAALVYFVETAEAQRVRPSGAASGLDAEIRKIFVHPLPDGVILRDLEIKDRIFDGTGRLNPQVLFERGKETLQKLNIQAGDTLVDLGTGELGGIGLLAAMGGAKVIAVERRAESVRLLNQKYQEYESFIRQAGGSYELIEGDVLDNAVLPRLDRKFKHVIATDFVTPSRLAATVAPRAPPTWEPEKIDRIFKLMASLKSPEAGSVLFSVPEFLSIQDRQGRPVRYLPEVPFRQEMITEVIRGSSTYPARSEFAAVPYSLGVKRGILFHMEPIPPGMMNAVTAQLSGRSLGIPVPLLMRQLKDGEKRVQNLLEIALAYQTRIDWQAADGTRVRAVYDVETVYDHESPLKGLASELVIHLYPTEEERRLNAGLEVLSMDPDMPGLPRPGSFGRIVVTEVEHGRRPALLITQIQPSHGYHHLAPEELKRYTDWKGAVIRRIIQLASELGYARVMVKSHKIVREENPNRDWANFFSISDENLYENYIRWFRGKWDLVRFIDPDYGGMENEYWALRLDSTARSEAVLNGLSPVILDLPAEADLPIMMPRRATGSSLGEQLPFVSRYELARRKNLDFATLRPKKQTPGTAADLARLVREIDSLKNTVTRLEWDRTDVNGVYLQKRDAMEQAKAGQSRDARKQREFLQLKGEVADLKARLGVLDRQISEGRSEWEKLERELVSATWNVSGARFRQMTQHIGIHPGIQPPGNGLVANSLGKEQVDLPESIRRFDPPLYFGRGYTAHEIVADITDPAIDSATLSLAPAGAKEVAGDIRVVLLKSVYFHQSNNREQEDYTLLVLDSTPGRNFTPALARIQREGPENYFAQYLEVRYADYEKQALVQRGLTMWILKHNVAVRSGKAMEPEAVNMYRRMAEQDRDRLIVTENRGEFTVRANPEYLSKISGQSLGRKRGTDFAARADFLEMMDLLNRNLWLIQGHFSPDGRQTFLYQDKEALLFKGDQPDPAAIRWLGEGDFDRLKGITERIILDRMRLGKLRDMRRHWPGDEDRMHVLADRLGINVRVHFRLFSELEDDERRLLRPSMERWGFPYVEDSLELSALENRNALIAYVGGEPAGAQNYRVGAKTVTATGLHVDEKWRGSGVHVATMLRENVLRYLKDEDFTTFQTGVDTNPSAQKFHQYWLSTLGSSVRDVRHREGTDSIEWIEVSLKKYDPQIRMIGQVPFAPAASGKSLGTEDLGELYRELTGHLQHLHEPERKDRAVAIWKRIKEITRETYNRNPDFFSGLRSKLDQPTITLFHETLALVRGRAHANVYGADFQPPLRVLERGPGIRDLRFYAAEPDLEVLAIDNAEASIAYIQKEYLDKELGSKSNITLQTADMETYTPAAEGFHMVRDWATLHHFPIIDSQNGADPVVRNAFDALPSGGIYTGVVKAGEGIELRDTKTAAGQAEGMGYRFYQLFDEHRLRGLLIRNGFHVLQVVSKVNTRNEPELVFIAEKPVNRASSLGQEAAVPPGILEVAPDLSAADIWKEMVAYYGLERYTSSNKTKVYISDRKYPEYVFKKKENVRSEPFTIRARPNPPDVQRRVMQKLVEKRFGLPEVMIRVLQGGRYATTNFFYQKRGRLFSRYIEKFPATKDALEVLEVRRERALWREGFFDVDARRRNRVVLSTEKEGHDWIKIYLMDFEDVHEIPADEQAIFDFLSTRTPGDDGTLHFSPGEHYLSHMFHFDDEEGRVQYREAENVRKDVFPSVDPGTRKRIFQIYRDAGRAGSAVWQALEENQKANPSLQDINSVSLAYLNVLAAPENKQVIDDLLKHLAHVVATERAQGLAEGKSLGRVEIGKFVRSLPLAEGHVHFGSSVPTKIIWKLALERDEIDWTDVSSKLSSVFTEIEGRPVEVNLNALLKEARAIEAMSEPGAGDRGRLKQLKKQFQYFSQFKQSKKLALNHFTTIDLVGRILYKADPGQVQSHAKEIALNNYRNGIRYLELRSSLPTGANENDAYSNILEKLSAIVAGLKEAESHINDKLKPDDIGFEAKLVLGFEKFYTEEVLEMQARALVRVLEDRPELREYFVGVDGQNAEQVKAPTQFIGVYGIIDEYNRTRARRREPVIGKTFHVGEDFDDVTIEGGIRKVHDAVEYLGLDRIGHGLVLGINVQQYMGKQRKENVSERIAQIYYDLKADKYDARGLESVGLEMNTGALIKELTAFGEKGEYKDYVRETIRPLIDAILRKQKLDKALERKLFAELARMKTFYPLATVTITYDKRRLRDLIKRQNYVLNKLIERNVAIEVSPTINIRIGPIENHAQHPLRQFHSYRYTGPVRKYKDAGVAVTVNTDNPQMLGIFLRKEYVDLAVGLHLQNEDLRQLAINGFRHRLGPHPLKYEAQIVKALGVQIEAASLGAAKTIDPSDPSSQADLEWAAPNNQFVRTDAFRMVYPRAEASLKREGRPGTAVAAVAAQISERLYSPDEAPEVREVLRMALGLDQVREELGISRETLLRALARQNVEDLAPIWLRNLVETNEDRGINIIPVKSLNPAELREVLSAVKFTMRQNPNKVLAIAYSGDVTDEMRRWIERDFGKESLFVFGGVTDYEGFLEKLAGQPFRDSSANQSSAVGFRSRIRELYRQDPSFRRFGLQSLLAAAQVYGQEDDFAGFKRSVPRRFMDEGLGSAASKDRLIAQLTLGVPVSGVAAASLVNQPPDYLVIRQGRDQSLSLSFDPRFAQTIMALAQAMKALEALAKAA